MQNAPGDSEMLQASGKLPHKIKIRKKNVFWGF
jgi:hypothetical protein